MTASQPVILVLLAAGEGKRFGGDKLLYQVDGRPMYRRAADLALELGEAAAGRMVVTGSEQIMEELSRDGFEIVENRQPELGISHSVRLAVEQAGTRPGGLCFMVCDQPWLTAATLESFLKAWKASGKGMSCLCHLGRRGNPVVFAEPYRAELKALSGDRGGRQVMNHHPEDVFFYEVEDERELRDLDWRPGAETDIGRSLAVDSF